MFEPLNNDPQAVPPASATQAIPLLFKNLSLIGRFIITQDQHEQSAHDSKSFALISCMCMRIFYKEKLTPTMAQLLNEPAVYDLYVRYLLTLRNAGRRKRFEVCLLVEGDTGYSSEPRYADAPAGVVFMSGGVGLMVQSGSRKPVRCLLQDLGVPAFWGHGASSATILYVNEFYAHTKHHITSG